MIGNAQIAMMALQVVVGVLGPAILFLVLKNKYHMKTESFIIGALVMLIFAVVLEGAVHRLVFGSSLGTMLTDNTLYYALYGGCMAALFEETGRYLAFHVIMKHLHKDDRNAIMYGAGHGGFEAFMVLGMTGISNIAMSLEVNKGNLPEYTGEAQEALEQTVNTLKNTGASAYLLGMVERVAAVMLQIALSIIVWQTVKQVKGRILYLFLAMLLHFAIDFTTVMLGNTGMLVLTEVVVFATAVALLAFAMRLYRKNQNVH